MVHANLVISYLVPGIGIGDELNSRWRHRKIEVIETDPLGSD
jgi:hypothetical protein